MALNTKNAYFEGNIYLGLRDAAGNPRNLQNIGLTDELKLSFKEEVKQLKGPDGGLVNTVRLLPEGSGSISARDLNMDVLAKVLRGNKRVVAAATNLTLSLPDGVSAGQLVPTGHLKISNVAVTGATAEQYTVNADTGSIVFNADIATAVSVTYDHGAYEGTGLLQTGAVDYYLYFEGRNLANGEPVILDLYKVRLGAAKELSLLGNDFAKLPVEFDLLKDTSRPVDDEFGQYGSYKQLA